MTMTKMTKIEMYEQILTHLTDADEIAFIQHEIELTAKKNASRSTKPTARQVENIAVAEKVLNAMETGHAYRVSEIGELIPELNGKNPQKIVGVVRILLKNGTVNRSEAKGVAYFTKI